MSKEESGSYTKSLLANKAVDKKNSTYLNYKSSLPSFPNQAVYIYSFKENRMLYTQGWEEILGYKDDEITMPIIIGITTERFMKFSMELNDKAMMFLKEIDEELEAYSFTIELEKIHKDGSIVPLFSRVGVHKSEGGQVTEIIGYSEVIKTLRLGNVMEYAAYGPRVDEFEAALNKELFQYYAISKKEREALNLAAKGFAFKEIAEVLGVSQSAIEKRIIPLYKRFKVRSLPHLIGFAYQNNIL